MQEANKDFLRDCSQSISDIADKIEKISNFLQCLQILLSYGGEFKLNGCWAFSYLRKVSPDNQSEDTDEVMPPPQPTETRSNKMSISSLLQDSPSPTTNYTPMEGIERRPTPTISPEENDPMLQFFSDVPTTQSFNSPNRRSIALLCFRLAKALQDCGNLKYITFSVSV